jgi:hypothetical protein
MDFLSWKIWTSLLFVPLYTCIFVYEFYLGYIIGIQYMICAKTLLEKINQKKVMDFWMA